MVLGEVGMVSTTPALVPTHSSSSHTSSAVILRQAALCCRMMASEPGVGDRPALGHGVAQLLSLELHTSMPTESSSVKWGCATCLERSS